MAGFITTFERKETKYVLNADQVRLMKKGLAGRLELDEYGQTRIDSLYFDTPNRDLISRSVEKPLYKEKLRVRAYGDAHPGSPVFIEIKKKFKGIVYKRRVRMSRSGAEAYFRGMPYEEAQRRFPVNGADDPSALSSVNVQIAREIDSFCSRHAGIGPSMVISCMREAWKPVDPRDPETDIRITFDERISFVDVSQAPFDYDAAVAAEGRDYALAPGDAVMEIKCAGSYPMWLVRLLDACAIRPRSFSKYGTSYEIIASRQREAVRQRVAASVRARKSRELRESAPASKRPALSFFSVFSPKRRRRAVSAN